MRRIVFLAAVMIAAVAGCKSDKGAERPAEEAGMGGAEGEVGAGGTGGMMGAGGTGGMMGTGGTGGDMGTGGTGGMTGGEGGAGTMDGMNHEGHDMEDGKEDSGSGY